MENADLNELINSLVEDATVLIALHRSIGCATPMRPSPSTPVPPSRFLSTTLAHADLKTTGIHAHARPGESSGRYLKTNFQEEEVHEPGEL